MKYHFSLRLVHWIMAICILGLIMVGWYMTGLSPQDDSRSDFYFYHKSFGVLIFLLFFVRIIIRKTTQTLALPPNIKVSEKKLSHIAHILLYILIVTVPIIGYMFSNSAGYSVSFFGLTGPDILDKNKEISDIAREMHWYAAYILLGIISIHVIGALKHRFFEPKENDVLNRMI